MNIVTPKMFMAKIITETFIKSVRDVVFLLYGRKCFKVSYGFQCAPYDALFDLLC